MQNNTLVRCCVMCSGMLLSGGGLGCGLLARMAHPGNIVVTAACVHSSALGAFSRSELPRRSGRWKLRGKIVQLNVNAGAAGAHDSRRRSGERGGCCAVCGATGGGHENGRASIQADGDWGECRQIIPWNVSLNRMTGIAPQLQYIQAFIGRCWAEKCAVCGEVVAPEDSTWWMRMIANRWGTIRNMAVLAVVLVVGDMPEPDWPEEIPAQDNSDHASDADHEDEVDYLNVQPPHGTDHADDVPLDSQGYSGK